tara:strand:+ start:425 stop:1555 length:1131 start_codon:yes stop_codon:yes gene_type:complete
LPNFKISNLSLNNFRNYKDIQLTLNKSPVIIFGENGSGKTNLLEAISFLSPGRGIRSINYEEVTHEDNDLGWSVNANVCDLKKNNKFMIGTGVLPKKKINKSGRILKVDKELKPITYLSEILSILWVTPQMDGIFLGETSKRRRFFDRLIFNNISNHIKNLNTYEKALRERSKILKEQINNEKWLDLVEKTLANSGVAISKTRVDCINLLNQKLFSVVGPFPESKVYVEGSIEEWLKTITPAEAEIKFLSEIKKSRSIDTITGRTKLGPHRSDFKVMHLKKNMLAEKCSTGEQKALLIALIIGQSKLLIDKDGRSPILLLDDIIAHLDYFHLECLFSEFFDINSQLWITATDPGILKSMISNFHLIKVADSKVHIV